MAKGVFIMDTTFTKAYNADLYCTELTPTERVLYMVLCSFDFDDDCKVHPTQETLSQAVGRSERQIRRCLKALEEKGYIAITTIKNFAYHTSKNIYFLTKKYSTRAMEAFKKLSTNTGHSSPENKGQACPTEYITFDKLTDDNRIQDIIKTFEEPKEVIDAALAKMQGKTILAKGFKTYLTKVINTVKGELAARVKGSRRDSGKYIPYKKDKEDKFNNYPQRDYEKEYPGGFDGLERALLGCDQ